MKSDILDWVILLCVIDLLVIGTYQRNFLWKDEIALWKDCVQKSPQKERTHHNLGFAYYERGQWGEAKKKFEEALRLNLRYPLSMYNLGLVFYQKGSMDEAIQWYKKALEEDSTVSDSYYNLGLAYYRKGDFNEAIEAYQTFLEEKPDYENAHNNLDLAFKGLKRWNEAIDSFREELKYHPENICTHVYLGETYLEMRDTQRALFHLKKVVDHPHFPEVDRIRKLISSIEKSYFPIGRGEN